MNPTDEQIAQAWWAKNEKTFYDYDSGYDEEQVALAAFKAGIEHAKPKWVSVAERLPEGAYVECLILIETTWSKWNTVRETDDEKTLVKATSKDRRVKTETFEAGEFQYRVDDNEKITHWMLIPPPPEAK